MTHADAFLRDILAHPDDDAPRLIFADWLEEQGDAGSVARAEFIRVQCALASGELPAQRRAELERRQQQLLEEGGNEWVRPIRRWVRSWEFHRGFIDSITVRCVDTFVTHGDQIFRFVPVQHLTLLPRMSPQFNSANNPPPINIAVFADNKHLRRLRGLRLSGNKLASRDVRALVVSEHLTKLTDLDLSYNRIGDSGIRALAEAPLIGQLTHLDLRHNDIGPTGVRALARALLQMARSPDGLRIRKVDLHFNNLSTAGQRLLADSPLLRRLVRW